MNRDPSRDCSSCKHETLPIGEGPCRGCYTTNHDTFQNWEDKSAEKQSASKCAFPEDDAERAKYPLFDGALAYFPNAIAYVAYISKLGSEKHNPGQPMHWARNKSTDHENKIARHLVDAGKLDSAGVRHSGNLAWRSLALLQAELEAAGLCPPSPASRFD